MRFTDQFNDWGHGWAMAVQHGPWRHGVGAQLRSRGRVPLKLKVKARRMLRAWAVSTKGPGFRLRLARMRRRGERA